MRLGICLPVLLLALAACGGDGEEGLSISPTSGSPGSTITVSSPCEQPPMVAEWTSSAGLSSFVASTDAQSELGLTSVPGDVQPGTYTVTFTCASRPVPVGEATFEVTG